MNKEFIYISIPRTGTNSIHAILGQVHDENHTSIRKINRKGYSFAFIRNPLDLAVSWWAYHNKFQKEHKVYQCEFKDWVKGGCKHHWNEGFCEYKGITHPLNQWEYVCDYKENKIVNFIGRYESLQEHFDVVIKKIGLKHKPLPKINGVKKGWWEDYYDNYTMQKIKEIFKKDFQLFNL